MVPFQIRIAASARKIDKTREGIGEELDMILGMAHAALVVRDYEEAKEFYCDKLGFIVVEDTRLKSKRWVRLKAPGRKGLRYTSFQGRR
jgi:catechol-2,3-dioxygenase